MLLVLLYAFTGRVLIRCAGNSNQHMWVYLALGHASQDYIALKWLGPHVIRVSGSVACNMPYTAEHGIVKS